MSMVLMDVKCCCERMPFVPDTQEADVETSPEPRSLRAAQAPQEYLV